MKLVKILCYTGFSLFIAACRHEEGITTPSPTVKVPVPAPVPVPVPIVGVAATGKTLYENNLCYTCHGFDALGGSSAIAVKGKTGSEIVQTMATQLVHSGIRLDEQGAYDLAAFLKAPAGVVALPFASFSQPEKCAICHPRQYHEWQGSMMRYGATSPVFAALELFANKMPGLGHPEGAFGTARLPALKDNNGNVTPDRDGDLFCQQCHNPIDSARVYPDPELASDQIGPEQNPFPVKHAADESTRNEVRPLRDFATELGSKGLSCDFCHQVTGPNYAVMLPTREGDGIANLSLNFQGGIAKQGVNGFHAPSPFHGTVTNNYLRSSEFCGACHDVRLPADDQATPAPDAQRLENLFTEWKQGPYGPAPNGNNTTCQDCHMSLYPAAPPGTYPSDIVTVYPNPYLNQPRRVATHYFTGVDVALSANFPGQASAGLDSHGLLIGQADRREALLKAAATLKINAPASIPANGTLSIAVDVTNVGAGHNIPSGFSQERQMWIELTVTDANGSAIYKSGYLVDSAHPETGELAPDGKLDDEDLQNFTVTLDPVYGNNIGLVHGADYNQRHQGINKGLVNFGNQFISYDDGSGDAVEEFLPFAAEHMDNSLSIPPLQTRTNTYDVALPAGVVGPITVKARLLFRAFPPRFIRFLANRTAEFNLLDEAVVDRNKIIEMIGPHTVAVTVTP